MCGIIGYIGPKKTTDVLLKGLKKLEYRGYDSSGVYLQSNTKTQLIKSVGKIKDLEDKINKTKLIDSNMGIAHTRWATTGEVTELNSHPHQVGQVTIVHNGIIENYQELKDQLINENINFYGETDTEVIATLLNKYLYLGYIEAIEKVKSLLIGSYALVIIFESDKDHIYALRKDSPLVVALGSEENFVASDILALTNYTNKYFLLEENEVAVISKDKVEVLNNKKVIEKQIKQVESEEQDNGKAGYKYFMEKEIAEEPSVIEKMLNKYQDLKDLPDISKYEEIHIIGCGSAMYAGMVGKTLLEEYTNTRAIGDVASEYRYKNNIYDRKTLIILISQSGETADTIAVLRKANENNIDTLGIVNVETSTIYRESKYKILTTAGREVAVATTKAYMSQVLTLVLLTVKQLETKKLINKDDEVYKDLNKLPDYVKEILSNEETYKNIAHEIYKSEDVFFLGRKIDYAISLEGSLKLKEISYIHSEAYQAGELKHGTISLIEENTPVFGIVTDEDIYLKTMSNIKETEARGANAIVITTSNLDIDAKEKIVIPKISKYLQPLLIVPVLQLIAYHTALYKGCDVDQPKNLAKSVTVE